MATLDSAMTIGEQFRRFWRWWTTELRAMVPSSVIHWTSRIRVAPLVVSEDRGFGIYRFDGVAWRRLAKVAGTSPEELAQKLGTELRAAGIQRFAVGLQPGQYLAKTVNVPLAAEDNLRNALRYELDRHTPFKPDDVGFDCCVLDRDERSRELSVRLVTAPKSAISNAVSAVAGTGLLVVAVCPAFPERAALPLNLLPHDEAANSSATLVRRWAPWVVLSFLVLAALLVPIYQKRAQVIALQPLVNIAAQQAQAADALHQQLDRALGEYNFLLQKRYTTPTSLQLLNEVTRILPDDTWVQTFELRPTSKGKEIQIQGETGVAGKMIELFENSPLLTGASFKSPLTQAAGSQASRFHLAVDVREAPPPPARDMSLQSTPAAIAGSPAGSAVSPPGAPGFAGSPGLPDPSKGVPAAAGGGSPAPVAAATPATPSQSPVASVPGVGVKPANSGQGEVGVAGAAATANRATDKPGGAASPSSSSSSAGSPSSSASSAPGSSSSSSSSASRGAAPGGTSTFNPGPAPF